MKQPPVSFRTIKALVFDCVHRHRGIVDYRELTEAVLKHFPDSRWKRTHWAWYRYQIVKGRFKNDFSEEERQNLQPHGRAPVSRAGGTSPAQERPAETTPQQRGPKPKDPEVKRLGDEILNHVRFVISLAAGDKSDLRFKLNRWVFSRLLQDEIRVKRPIKQQLWDSGIRACQACTERFGSLKGVELHRKDKDRGYSVENCELLCRECHHELASPLA